MTKETVSIPKEKVFRVMEIPDDVCQIVAGKLCWR